MATLVESPKFAVLRASGINRDEATKAAIESVGGRADLVHVKQFIDGEVLLPDYQGLIIPGGFSYGDHIQSGVALAHELRKGLSEELLEHIYQKHRPVIGICNGFQTLVQLGLLPFGEIVSRDKISASLTKNDSGRFESRWVKLAIGSPRTPLLSGWRFATLPVAHGEGKFIASNEVVDRMEKQGQVVYQYVDELGLPTGRYPDNPNGSLHAIAGITDETGIIFGMMPHPEDYIIREHYPNWRREKSRKEPDGKQFFKDVVVYARSV